MRGEPESSEIPEEVGPSEGTPDLTRTFKRLVIRTATACAIGLLAGPLVFGLAVVFAIFVCIEEAARGKRGLLQLGALALAGLALPFAVLVVFEWFVAWTRSGPLGVYRFALAGPASDVPLHDLLVLGLYMALVFAAVGASRSRVALRARLAASIGAIVLAGLAGVTAYVALTPNHGIREEPALWGWGIGAYLTLVLVVGLRLSDAVVKGAARCRSESARSVVLPMLVVILLAFFAAACTLREKHEARMRLLSAKSRLHTFAWVQQLCMYERAKRERSPGRYSTLGELTAAVGETVPDREFGYVFDTAPSAERPGDFCMVIANPVAPGSGPSLFVVASIERGADYSPVDSRMEGKISISAVHEVPRAIAFADLERHLLQWASGIGEAYPADVLAAHGMHPAAEFPFTNDEPYDGPTLFPPFRMTEPGE